MSFLDELNKISGKKKDVKKQIDVVDTPTLPQVPQMSSGGAATGPGTTTTPGGVQGVNLQMAPEGYINPQKQININTAKSKERKKGRLYERYENFTKNGGDGGQFMEKISGSEQDTLNSILEKQRQEKSDFEKFGPQISQSKGSPESAKGYSKALNQRAIAESDEGFVDELGTAIVKGTQGLGEGLSGIGGAARGKILDSSRYSADELRESQKTGFVKEEHDIERTEQFDMTDLGTQRFWVDLVGGQLPYFGYGATAGLVGRNLTKSAGNKISQNLLKKELTPKASGYTEIGGAVAGYTTSTALINGGDTYNNLIDAGETPEVASKGAQEVMLKTYATALTDIPQFLSVFGKVKIPTSAKLSGVMATEAGEELYEEWVQTDVQKRIITGEGIGFMDFAKSPEGKEIAISGALGGAMFTGAGKVYDIYQKAGKGQSDTLIEYAQRGDDSFLDQVDNGVLKGEIKNEHGSQLKNLYIWAKDEFKRQAEPIVEKIAQKTGAKMNLVDDNLGTGIDGKKSPEKTKVYFGGVEGGITGISQEKGILDVTTDKEYASRYKTKHQIQQKKPGELYEGEIDTSEVFTVQDINSIQDVALKEKIEKYTDGGKHEIRWEEIGQSKDGGKSVIEGLKTEGYKGFAKQEREGIDSISIFDEGLLNEVDLKPVKTKQEPTIDKTEKKLIANDIDSLRGINELKQEDKEYYDDFDSGKDEKYKLITKLEGEGVIKESKQEGGLRYYSLTNKGSEASRSGPTEIAHYPDDLYKKFEQKQKESFVKSRAITKKKRKKPTVSNRLKTGQEKRLEKKRIQDTGEKLRDINITDVANLLKEETPFIVKQGVNYAVQKGIIDKSFGKQINEAIKDTKGMETKAPTGRITGKQKLWIQDMLGYDKIFKKLEELKISIPQVAKSLKNIGARLHIVNTPEGSRVKLPFSLMGNKSATFRQILLPMIKKATKQGAKNYVEPFGGAGTVYYFADEMIASGIENIHVNHFDNEKYQVVKAIKDKKMSDIQKDVSEAFDEIVDNIGELLADIPEIQEIMTDYNVQVGTKEFKELAELSFYPQYAQQFFQERPDTKLAVKGETTSSFKEWLREHLEKKAKDEGKVLEGEQLDTAVEAVLSDRGLFENQYPEISKRISTILDKYDDINLQDGDYKKAIRVSMARHFRQRGDSGQKVVSASGGFQNVINAREKMIDGLTKYKQVFDRHGDKISIYNEDGKEFINNMGTSLNNKETISYLDPPYVRTTGVYIKNQPKEIQESLEEYANPDKVDQLFEPLKDTIMMFTNDVDGKYFETLDRMLEGRMSKDIIAYREGTTPTSLVTTNEIAVKPKDVGLSYYKILKNSYTRDIMKSLKEGLLPKISNQLKKPIAKINQHFEDLLKKKFGDITKIQEQQFKGKEAFEQLEESLSNVVSGRDRQKIINESKKWLKQNVVTGSDVVKMINKVNKLWINRQEKIKEVRKRLKSVYKSGTIDAEYKKALSEWFNGNYTDKKISGKIKEDLDIIDKINNGGDFTPEEFETFDKWMTDEDYHNKVEKSRKESIYNLDVEKVEELLNKIKDFEKIGSETKKYREFQKKTTVDKFTKQAEKSVKTLESNKRIKNKTIQKIREKSWGLDKSLNKVERGTKKLMIEATPAEWVLDDELNIHREVYDITDRALNSYRDFTEKVKEGYDTKVRELKVSEKGLNKITLHGLSKRGDGKGTIKIIAYIKKYSEDPVTGKKINSNEGIMEAVQSYKSDEYLSENEKELYNYMRKQFDEIGIRLRATKLEDENVIMETMEDYFPIKIDVGENDTKFSDYIDPEISQGSNDMFRKTGAAKGFTEQATGLAIIPELNAEKVFLNHVERAGYYAEMQSPIKTLNEVINNLGEEKLGDLGLSYMKNYVDTLAKQGLVETKTTRTGRGVAQLVRNFQQAILGFSPATTLLQTSGLIEAMGTGGKVNPSHYKDIIKKDVWNMISEKSGTVRNREYKNLFGYEGDKWHKGIMEKWNTIGFIPIQKVDGLIARKIWYTQYKGELKDGKSEQDAIYEADKMVRKSIAHTHFEGKPRWILKNERGIGSMFTIFQSFVLNHSAMLRYGGGKKVQQKYGKVKGYIFAMGLLLVAFGAYEELIRGSMRKLHKQKDYGTNTSKAFSQIIGNIPYVGVLYNTGKYGSPNFISGIDNTIKGVESKELSKILYGLGVSLGIGGTAEMNRLYKGYIKEDKKSGTKTKTKKKKKKTITRKKRKRTD